MLKIASIEGCEEILQLASQQVMESGNFINGKEVARFEADMCRFSTSEHAIAVNSGTDALIIVLQSLGIKPGDEVIATPFSFVATAEAIKRVGASPVFVDIDDTCNLDLDQIEDAINVTKTKAVLAVNLYGNPCEAGRLEEICRQNNLKLIFDSAQAFGATYDSVPINKFADATIYSFYPTKILGGISDGGMILTDNAAVACKAKRYRNHGFIEKNDSVLVGYNSRMSEIQGAFLRYRLQIINMDLVLRKAQAVVYGLNLPERVLLKFNEGCVWNSYTICTDRRDVVAKCLQDNGIETKVYYDTLITDMEPYQSSNQFQRAEFFKERVLSLPIGSHVTSEDIKKICSLIVNCI